MIRRARNWQGLVVQMASMKSRPHSGMDGTRRLVSTFPGLCQARNSNTARRSPSTMEVSLGCRSPVLIPLERICSGLCWSAPRAIAITTSFRATPRSMLGLSAPRLARLPAMSFRMTSTAPVVVESADGCGRLGTVAPTTTTSARTPRKASVATSGVLLSPAIVPKRATRVAARLVVAVPSRHSSRALTS